MALEANRKDTTQTRGLVIFISNIFSTYFVYSQKFSYNIKHNYWHIRALLQACYATFGSTVY